MLHITNGDCAVAVMREAKLEGDYLAWQDVLHEGPVPEGLSLDELSRVRIEFIAGRGWAPREQVQADFAQRDAQLKRFNEYEQIILWFEHDLYDQLQLLQILDWFAGQSQNKGLGKTRLSLINTDQYLGEMSAPQLAALFGTQKPVTDTQLNLARQAWEAFRSPDPLLWRDLLQYETRSLPYLAQAVERQLQQFPSVSNGANRIEQAILETVAASTETPQEIFSAYQQTETARFLGDRVFWDYILDMNSSEPPLLVTANALPFRVSGSYPYTDAFKNQHLKLSKTGEAVLKNQADWLHIKPINKWLGGVHLHEMNIWRWDRDTAQLVQTEALDMFNY